MGEDTTLERLVQTGFKPSEHGFRFANRFPEHVFGAVCGGMSFAAADFFYSNRKIPQQEETPEQNSLLYHYLLRRQIESFGTLGRYGVRLVQWMRLADDELWKETYDEFRDVKTMLDDGKLVQLYLVYKDASQGLNPLGNHQVLAYGYSEFSDSVYLHISDPNHPGDDDEVIVLDEVQQGNALGLRCEQQWTGGMKHVRGFFINRHYKQKIPPENL